MDHERPVEPVRQETDDAGGTPLPPLQGRTPTLPWQSLTDSGAVSIHRSLAELNFNLDILRHRTHTVLASLDPSGSPDERALFRLTERLELELGNLQALARALRTE